MIETTPDRVEIARDNRHFTRNGRPWFYLADTAWSTMTNPTDQEWDRYLDLRAEQGFTAIQVNILPQWDRSGSAIPIEPFAVQSDGTGTAYDFSRPNTEYFELVTRRTAAITARGMVPVVVLLWCDFVPDTWASQRMPGNIIPGSDLEAYLELAVKATAPSAPIYMVSGDTDFQTDRSVAYYQLGLEVAKRLDPQGLTTLHLNGEKVEIDERLQQSELLDFYNYQSGHSASSTDKPYLMAQAFFEKKPARPIVNAEPCYEGHARGPMSQRYSAYEVRRAAWQSVLSGASAGVTYGAHGIWSWHREGLPFKAVNFAGIPYPWDTAIRFEGAWDYGYLKTVIQEHGLFDLVPVDLGSAGSAPDSPAIPDGFRASFSKSTGLTVIYLPFPLDLSLPKEFADLQWKRVDLDLHRVATPRVVSGNDGCWISKGEQLSDALLIGAEKNQ
ncbi:MAG: DUF4038 domain-containing protein [Spirochaetales bacterium]|nr:MAG: DUF4038 domain-containing protein [Spirochaetales bacterium]